MPNLPNRARYAARLNAFRLGLDDPAITDLIARAAGAGLDAADLNYPDHFSGQTAAGLALALSDRGLALNGLAVR